MTTLVAETPAAPADSTREEQDDRPRGLTFLSRAVKTRGYSRVGTGALACGTINGVPARLVLPIERVVVAEARVRVGGTRLATNATVLPAASSPYTDVANDALTAAAAACGIDAGELSVEVQLPIKAATGTDLLEATALAVLDSVSRASGVLLSAQQRHTLAGAALGTHASASGLAFGGPAVVAGDGQLLTVVDAPRLHLFIAAPADNGTDAGSVLATEVRGTLTTLPDRQLDAAGLLAWLGAAAGAPQHPVADAIATVCSESGRAVTVVGGQSASAPVIVLLDPAKITVPEQQRLMHRLRTALPERFATWRLSMAKTATSAPPAAL